MSILKNLNYLTELQRFPCREPSMWIIIKTAFQSAPPALLMLTLPGCTEIVKARIGKSPWHLRGISGLIKEAVKPLPLGSNKFLYNIGYNTAEKYLWWWLVADVTTEFATTWQSMIYQEQQCQLPGYKMVYGYPTAFVYGPGMEGGLALTPESTNECITWAGARIMIQPGCEATVGYTVQWDSWPVRGEGGNVNTWYTVDDDPLIHDFSSSTQDKFFNPGVTGGSFYHSKPGFTAPTIYNFFYHNTSDKQMQAVGGSISISAMGRRQGNTRWGCRPKPVEWPFPNPLG